MADYVKDILLDDDFDLLIQNGDAVIGASDEQHIALILKTYPGAWKFNTYVGVGIDQYLASSGNEDLIKRNISVQLKADNYQVNKITLTKTSDNNFSYFIDAERVQ